ncbi:MAG: hypothetical protein KY476_11645 [Planctomycetes bacterium]|nr:hypothetical protein [Planctomycetota bacterium]
MAVCLIGCGESDGTTVEQPAEPRPVAVIVSGDTAGWIIPCGCASNQSGGLPRRGTFLAQQRQEQDIVYADAGGAPGGTSAYDRSKFAAILRGERALGVAAHNLGGPEVALGADVLRELGEQLDTPFISANLRDSGGRALAPPLRIVNAGGRRIAFVGVVSPRYAAAGCRIEAPRESILSALSEIEGRYDWLIVLAYLPESELRELAAALPEAVAVVGGPTGQSIAPAKVGATLAASATNKGKFLIELSAPEVAGGAWSGRAVEMAEEFADDPQQSHNVEDWRRELAGRDFSAGETGFAPLLAQNLPADYSVAGSLACRDCHEADYESWRASNHAHAWSTLSADGAHADSYCQQCHTTGYGLRGGFQSIAQSAARIDVGCESCHGPSAAHAGDPARHRTPFAAADVCVT